MLDCNLQENNFKMDIIYRQPSLLAVFLSAVLLISGPKFGIFKELVLQFKPSIGLFIRGSIILSPKLEKHIYRE